MKEDGNEHTEREPAAVHVDAHRAREDGSVHVNVSLNGRTPHSSPFNLWSALDAVLWRWDWLVLGLIIGGGIFYLLGWYFVRPKFTAVAELLRYEPLGRS